LSPPSAPASKSSRKWAQAYDVACSHWACWTLSTWTRFPSYPSIGRESEPGESSQVGMLLTRITDLWAAFTVTMERIQ